MHRVDKHRMPHGWSSTNDLSTRPTGRYLTSRRVGQRTDRVRRLGTRRQDPDRFRHAEILPRAHGTAEHGWGPRARTFGHRADREHAKGSVGRVLIGPIATSVPSLLYVIHAAPDRDTFGRRMPSFWSRIDQNTQTHIPMRFETTRY